MPYGKSIIIVGAGPGGLAAAMILAERGYRVTILEMADEPGGRNRPIRLGPYTFDTGPTFLMLPFVLEHVFSLAGEKLEEHCELIHLDPMYRLDFGGKVLHPTTDHAAMRERIAAVFPGQEAGLDRYLEREHKRLRAMYPCLQKPYDSLGAFFDPIFIRAAPHLAPGRNLFSVLGDYFAPADLRVAFSFQSKYLGMSPWHCPGFFAMLSYMEHAYGVYHVRGGLNRISAQMAEVAVAKGAQVCYRTRVARVLTEGRRATGVELEGGETLTADRVILNADFSWAAEHLLPRERLRRWHPDKLEKKQYSCSTCMLYLGMRRSYDLDHHNIFFAADYRANVDAIFDDLTLGDDHSFYVQNACVTDPELAPAGHSTLYVLIPVPNRRADIDWTEAAPRLRDWVLDRLAARLEIDDLRPDIVEEIMLTPDSWEEGYHVYRAAEFSMAHTLGQMLYWRPHNAFEELNRLYLVGGGTHPGSGLPTIWESGRITADCISAEDGLTVPPKQDLPPPGSRPAAATRV